MKIVLIAGTFEGHSPEWIVNPHHPFRVMLSSEGIDLALANGRPFSWSTRMGGIPFINRGVWEREAHDLVTFSMLSGCFNWFAYSHGGQLAIHAAKMLQGHRRVRTLTTIGTPVRRDVPSPEAAQNIDLWQHVFDIDGDRAATMRRRIGSLFDGRISFGRTFNLPGVQNIGMKGIRHGDVIHGMQRELLRVSGVLKAIKGA